MILGSRIILFCASNGHPLSACQLYVCKKSTSFSATPPAFRYAPKPGGSPFLVGSMAALEGCTETPSLNPSTTLNGICTSHFAVIRTLARPTAARLASASSGTNSMITFCPAIAFRGSAVVLPPDIQFEMTRGELQTAKSTKSALILSAFSESSLESDFRVASSLVALSNPLLISPASCLAPVASTFASAAANLAESAVLDAACALFEALSASARALAVISPKVRIMASFVAWSSPSLYETKASNTPSPNTPAKIMIHPIRANLLRECSSLYRGLGIPTRWSNQCFFMNGRFSASSISTPRNTIPVQISSQRKYESRRLRIAVLANSNSSIVIHPAYANDKNRSRITAFIWYVT